MKKGFSTKPLIRISGCLLLTLVITGVALAQTSDSYTTGPQGSPGSDKEKSANADQAPGPPPAFAPKNTGTPPKFTPPKDADTSKDTSDFAGQEKQEDKGWFTKNVIESSLIIHYRKGGFIMYFILACSVGGLYIFLERTYALQKKKMLPPEFLEEILAKVPEGTMDLTEERRLVKNLIGVCVKKDIPLSRSLRSGLLVHTEGIAGAKAAIVANNDREGALLTKGVPTLSLLSNVAPLLGLLGTVTGMIRAFDMLASGGAGKPEVVAGGISEALTTTAGGLFVGIPLLLLTNIAQGKIDNILLDIEEFAMEVIERLIFREGEEESE